MEFALSEQQQMMQQSVDGVLKRVCPLDRVRKFADKGEARAQDVWHQLAQLGIAGVVIPEQYGGMGLGILEAALVAEALGRHVAPVPFIGASVMAPLALMKAGTVRQRDHWLPHLASGKTTIGVALSEFGGSVREGAGITANNGKLSGKALFAIDFAEARALILAYVMGRI